MADSGPDRLADDLRLGPVHLTVRDLDRSVAYYQDVIGLRLHRREDPVAAMGAGEEDLVVLTERPDARPPGRHAGLYHFALLHPSRRELARAADRIAARRAPIQGASDHGTHEAIYLPDPDGNGIELAADRPREAWPDPNGPGYVLPPEPLDTAGLRALTAGEEPPRHADPKLTMGHVHLHVGDLAEALRFYRDEIGFELQASLPTAAFVSAGGYHHHLAFNTWKGHGAPPPPPDAVGLRHWTVVLPDPAAVDAMADRLKQAGRPFEHDGDLLVHDPSGTALRVTARPQR